MSIMITVIETAHGGQIELIRMDIAPIPGSATAGTAYSYRLVESNPRHYEMSPDPVSTLQAARQRLAQAIPTLISRGYLTPMGVPV